ncbi:3-isopropylmalate dehydratase small subunit [Aliikangiella marina]|uniref:3-isopropylmalate dehydratase small subunit n=1 Tax=Aliikangiella marina TaxID=1712262 RepID=A0A545TDJ4_9GAMM|nr:3-isopropylmalate dehydratase small subunit [Aliikangiella marina]TQV75292.1 3-isopropylmalate dehydratase small subunit [Aliikangiella marina]
MESLKQVETIAAVLPIENIDTDQIIPAEYLKITTKEGLGQHVFSNWRYDSEGGLEQGFVLNCRPTNSAKVLIAGDNFGCGSSREHAPWALTDFGIKVVISSSIADIFRNNAVKNGLLPIVVDSNTHQELLQSNGERIKVDIVQQSIHVNGMIYQFKLEPFTRYCFLNGLDQLDFLFKHEQQISDFESRQECFL